MQFVHTCVFYHPTAEAAEKQLTALRQVDGGTEIKAYIIYNSIRKEFRLLRKALINFS